VVLSKAKWSQVEAKQKELSAGRALQFDCVLDRRRIVCCDGLPVGKKANV